MANECPKTGLLGVHLDSCYRVVTNCGQHEHDHNPREGGPCFTKDGTLKCALREHSHTVACSSAEGPFCGGSA